VRPVSAPVGWPYDQPNLVPVQAMTKTELAYLRIRQQILEGELAPGQPLDQETLASSLGLSTTPVREALRRLESEHLVVNQAHRDTVVAPLSFRMLEEVYSVRLSLDPLAAASAASAATPEERDLMQALAEEALEGGDEVAHLHLNRRLHRTIYAASGNSVLVQLLDQLWDMSDRYRLITLKDNAVIKSAKQEHAAIVRAVRDDKPELASRLMREHVADSLARIRTSSRISD
jgi:DNA-binding GntR family transcriptional regulator